MPADVQVLDGRYELRSLLGQGAMGQVWYSWDRVLRRRVAIKVIHPGRLADTVSGGELQVLVARFRREAQFIARFSHPGLPVLYDAQLEQSPDRLYMVMELVLGEDLGVVLRREKCLPQTRAAAIAANVCEILEHTHADPVIHRDIKPGNIFLTGDVSVKLLDFGVAAAFGTAYQRLTTAGQLLGTLAYMAPEQFDQDARVDPQTDLYAVACVLYEMLTGQPPFTGSNIAVMKGHCARRPVPPRLLRPEIDAALDALVMEGLAKHPGDRPPSAGAFLERLAPFHPPHTGPLSTRVAALTGRGTANGGKWSALELSLDVRMVQALALFDEGRFTSALVEYTAVAQELAAAGDRSDDALWCRSRIAYCHQQLGHHAEALKQYQALVTELSPLRASDDELLLDAMRHRGLLLATCGDMRAALEALAELYPVLVDLLGTAAPETAEVRTALNRIREQRSL